MNNFLDSKVYSIIRFGDCKLNSILQKNDILFGAIHFIIIVICYICLLLTRYQI